MKGARRGALGSLVVERPADDIDTRAVRAAEPAAPDIYKRAVRVAEPADDIDTRAVRVGEPAAPDIYKRAVRAAERSLREPSVVDIHKLARRAP